MSEHDAMSEMLNMEEKYFLDKKKKQSQANSARLQETVQRKKEANDKALVNIFEKMRVGEIPAAPVTNSIPVQRLDEKEEAPFHDPEETKIVKAPTKESAAPKKSLSVERPHYGSEAKPMTKSKVNDDFNIDTTFSEKLNEVQHEIPTESLTNPQVKDTVTKLRNMAKQLRGEDVAQPDKPLVVQPVNAPHGQLMESTEPVFSLKQLNTMLYRAQDKFNQTGNNLYESIADELSTVIAEALLSNKKSVPKTKISGPTRSF